MDILGYMTRNNSHSALFEFETNKNYIFIQSYILLANDCDTVQYTSAYQHSSKLSLNIQPKLTKHERSSGDAGGLEGALSNL